MSDLYARIKPSQAEADLLLKYGTDAVKYVKDGERTVASHFANNRQRDGIPAGGFIREYWHKMTMRPDMMTPEVYQKFLRTSTGPKPYTAEEALRVIIDVRKKLFPKAQLEPKLGIKPDGHELSGQAYIELS